MAVARAHPSPWRYDGDMETTAPSITKILAATVCALVAAGLILITFVLPAEYGIDPLGSGRALGLTAMADVSEQPQMPAAAPQPDPAAAQEAATIVPVWEQSPRGVAPKVKGAFLPQPAPFQIDSREMVLAPKEGMEIKYNMKKGAGLIYSWTASGTLTFEFHGAPNVKPAGKEGTDYFESYELDDAVGKNEMHGTLVAPTTGIHGWYWENKTAEPVTLKLVSAGFYNWVFHNRHEKQTALKPMDAYAVPGHPVIPDVPMR